MRVTVCQLNPIVGDIEGNLARIMQILSRFGSQSDLIVFPELFLVGYPPRDLLEKPVFIWQAQHALAKLADASAKYSRPGILLGLPLPTGKSIGRGLYNSAVLIYQGKILLAQPKSLLPTYDVFDEARYFDLAPKVEVVSFKNDILGISICEDAWNDLEFWPRRFYSFDPIGRLVKKGATLLINISASPFQAGKEEIRYRLVQNHAKKMKFLLST